MPAAIRSVIRARRKFQSGPAADGQLVGDVGRQLGGRLHRPGGPVGAASSDAGPRPRSSARTHCSGTNSSVRVRRPPSAFGRVLASGPCLGPASRTVLRPPAGHAPPALADHRGPGATPAGRSGTVARRHLGGTPRAGWTPAGAPPVGPAGRVPGESLRDAAARSPPTLRRPRRGTSWNEGDGLGCTSELAGPL